MDTTLKKLMAAGAVVVAAGISSEALAWNIEGKVDVVRLNMGPYNGGVHTILISPIDGGFQWRVRNRLDRCNNLASDALGDNTTVRFRGPAAPQCQRRGLIRNCPGFADRCVSFRNR